MSSIKLVQRPLLNELSSSIKDTEELVETGGIVFSDGFCLELIRDDANRLSLLHSNRERGAPRIKHQGRIYVPPTISGSLVGGLTLPTRRLSGSTIEIFTKMCALFTEFGLSDKTARKLGYWALSTWFADLFPLAPCLILSGSRPESNLVLQLLACVVRHGLPLADIALSELVSLPMQIQPTLLIRRLSPGTRKVLSASTYPRAYLPMKHGLVDVYCAKAVYAGTHLVDEALDSAFRVHLAPLQEKLPVIAEVTERNLAAEFQSLLLDYRMRHVAEVRDSDFDVLGLGLEARMLARVLGCSIVDAPELRTDFVNLLQEYQEEICTGSAFNVESIAVEALLSHSHSYEPDQLIYVGQLADTSNRILKERGSREKLEPKALGWTIRSSLGLSPKRNAKGFAVKLTEEVRHRIHQRARDLHVSVEDEQIGKCSYCTERFAPDGLGGKSNSETTSSS